MFFNPSDIEQVLREVVNNFLIPKFKDLGMNATGDWLNAVDVEVGYDYGVILGMDYSEDLAKGREPGRLPPINAIKRWVMAKFGTTGPDAERHAWAVATNIARSGTTWYQRGGSDLIEVLEREDVKDYIRERMSGILRVTIAENLIRNAQEAFV